METDSKSEPCSFKTCVAMYQNQTGNVISIHEKRGNCFAFWTIGRDNELAHVFWTSGDCSWSEIRDLNFKISLDQDHTLHLYNDALILLKFEKIIDKYRLVHDQSFLENIIFCKLNTRAFDLKNMYKILEENRGNRNYLCILQNEHGEYKVFYCSIPDNGKTFNYSKPLEILDSKSDEKSTVLRLKNETKIILYSDECKANRSQWILGNSNLLLQKVTPDRSKKLLVKVEGIFQIYRPQPIQWWN